MRFNHFLTMRLHCLLWCIFIIAACSSSDAQTVYITKTGAKYHDGSCRYLSRSKIEIEFQEAIDRGYTACSVCDPQVEVEEDEQETVKQPQGQTPPKAKPNTTTVKKSTTSSSQCTAYTKAGTRCKRSASSGGKCWQHQ